MKERISKNFNTIKDESLSEKAASLIRRKIIAGELAASERLTETDLAQALGISRACLREALHTLEYEGLVLKRANKYTQVVDLKQNDIEEIYHLRAAVECCCFEMGMMRGLLSEDDLAAKGRAVDARHTHSHSSREEHAWIDADFAFHEMIVISSNNPRAIDTWMRLKNQARLVLYRMKDPAVIGNHAALAKLLCSAPLTEASQALKDHIMAGYRLVDILTNLEDPTDTGITENAPSP